MRRTATLVIFSAFFFIPFCGNKQGPGQHLRITQAQIQTGNEIQIKKEELNFRLLKLEKTLDLPTKKRRVLTPKGLETMRASDPVSKKYKPEQ